MVRVQQMQPHFGAVVLVHLVLLATSRYSSCYALLQAPSSSFCGRETPNSHGVHRSILSLSNESEQTAFRAEQKTLDQIFTKDRNFLFTTQKNMRSYEWSTKEAEEMLDKITALEEDESHQLNSIILMEKRLDTEDRKKIGKSSKVYDVRYDYRAGRA
jgi:hypothetical protein